MATDGVKIIDGDTAHNTYSTFFEMYNNGATIQSLIDKYEEDKNNYAHEILAEEYEICVTAYALAFWEICALTPDMLKEVEAVIAKQATVKDWSEQIGNHAGKARQRELNKFLKKISTPRAQPKARINKLKGLSGNEKTLLKNATQLSEQGKYKETQQICEQLLLENPDCHKSRKLLIESLIYGSNDEEDAVDWVAVEKHCKYMLNNRDIDRNELSQPKKRRIVVSWYGNINGYLHRALRNQQKYGELQKYTKDNLTFELAALEGKQLEDYHYLVTIFESLYKCCCLLNDTQQLENVKELYKVSFPKANWKRDFANWEKYLENL